MRSLLSARKSFGKREIKRRAWRRSTFDSTHRLYRQSKEVIRVSAFPPFGLSFVLIYFVQFSSFSVPICLFIRVSLPAPFLLFLILQTNHNKASLSYSFAGIRESIRCNGLHIHSRHPDLSFVNKNASDSILHNNEPNSMKTDETYPQPEKQEEPIISTVRGMMINARDQQENALDRIARRKRSAPIRIFTRRRCTGSLALTQIPQQSRPVEHHKCNAVKHNRWLVRHPSICSRTVEEVVHLGTCEHESELPPDFLNL
jgi:hypothetical protein